MANRPQDDILELSLGVEPASSENPQSGSNDNQFIVDNFAVTVLKAGTSSLLILGASLIAFGSMRQLRGSRR